MGNTKKKYFEFGDYKVTVVSKDKVIISGKSESEITLDLVEEILRIVEESESMRRNFTKRFHFEPHPSARGQCGVLAQVGSYQLRKSKKLGCIELRTVDSNFSLDIELLYLIRETLVQNESANMKEIKLSYEDINPLTDSKLFTPKNFVVKTIERLEREKEILESLKRDFDKKEDIVVEGIEDLGFYLYKRIKRQESIVMNLERIINTNAERLELIRLETEILDYLTDQLEYTTMHKNTPDLHSKIKLVNRIVEQEQFVKNIKLLNGTTKEFLQTKKDNTESLCWQFHKFKTELNDLKSFLIAKELKCRLKEGKIYKAHVSDAVCSKEFNIVEDSIVRKCKYHHFLVITELGLVLDPTHSDDPVPLACYKKKLKEWNSGIDVEIDLVIS